MSGALSFGAPPVRSGCGAGWSGLFRRVRNPMGGLAGAFWLRALARAVRCVLVAAALCVPCSFASATVTVFFNPEQTATPVSSGITSDTISSEGYLFTYTRDKLFTGGGSVPIGRSERVSWPEGVEAQAVTTPPPGVTDYKARLTIARVDGGVFDMTAITFRLLANTGATGAAVEIMPLVNGEDAFNDPLYFDASGYYGQSFSYDESPSPWGSTALLKGFDTYKIALFVDFAFTALTLQDPTVTPPCPGDADGSGFVDFDDVASVLANWLSACPPPCLGDADASGFVDFDDIACVLANWLSTCP